MAKKAELLEEATKLNLDVSQKNTIKEIEAAIEAVQSEHANTPEDTHTTESTAEDRPLAKSGKRSAKGIKEAEEKAAKEERKGLSAQTSEEEVSKPKVIEKRKPRIERRGKKFQAAAKLVEKGKEYSTKEALELSIKTSSVNFDASVEMHVKLGVDPKQADQNIRENVILPEGSGKNVRVAVYGEADDVTAAKAAGADIAGGEEFLQQLEKGQIEFDVLVATPMVMKNLGKYARVLGPKGLMPNPKSGTVTKDVTKAIKDAKAGKVEVRVDETAIVHLSVGKVSFGADRLMKNSQAIYSAIKNAKPSGLKGNYVESIYFTSSMGPSVKVSASEI